eukprot:1185321-Prorocentrum_minimum.AAC.2
MRLRGEWYGQDLAHCAASTSGSDIPGARLRVSQTGSGTQDVSINNDLGRPPVTAAPPGSEALVRLTIRPTPGGPATGSRFENIPVSLM